MVCYLAQSPWANSRELKWQTHMKHFSVQTSTIHICINLSMNQNSTFACETSFIYSTKWNVEGNWTKSNLISRQTHEDAFVRLLFNFKFKNLRQTNCRGTSTRVVYDKSKRSNANIGIKLTFILASSCNPYILHGRLL